MDTREWMRKYLSKEKSKGGMMLLCAAGVIMGIVFLANAKGDMTMDLLGLLFLAGGAYLGYQYMNTGSDTKNWMDMMEREGKLQTILTDFRDAADYLGGELRMGREWCFGRGAKIPVRYEEILRAYQYIHKTNFAEDSRMLVVVTVSGSEKGICELPLGGKGDQELNRVLNFMLSKNPRIQIGCNK